VGRGERGNTSKRSEGFTVRVYADVVRDIKKKSSTYGERCMDGEG